MAKQTPIVSVEWLMEHLSDPDIQIIDASWQIPSQNIDVRAQIMKERIPGAIYFDLEEIAAPRDKPPFRMMPSAELFAEKVGALGIRPDAHLVVYDNTGLYSAGRVWWMFRSFGHRRVSVLDGGLPAWKAKGGRLESGPLNTPPPTVWEIPAARPNVRDWQQVLQNIESRKEQLVDVRPPEYFNGDTSALYSNVRPGHVPGAINLSQRDLRNEDGTFKTPEEMRRIMARAGVDLSRPIIASCGSGVTAAILALASEIIGEGEVAIYDGSWEEWGSRSDLPAETG